MLRSIKDLMHYKIAARDGDIGHARDFFFDDNTWTVRYLVVETGSWLNRDRTLVSPAAIEEADWASRQLHVNLTREEVRNAPDVDSDKPISRRNEEAMASHYSWPMYWGAPGMIGPPVIPPGSFQAVARLREKEETEREEGDPHLRSAHEVLSYRIQAEDGPIGRMDDFIVDDKNWILRYLIVDTRILLPGKKVLVSPGWISEINWDDSRVHIDMERYEIKTSPQYDPGLPINRVYEEILHDFYGRPKYWND